MRTRRKVLLGGCGSIAFAATFSVLGQGQEVSKDVRDLLPNEFTWHPERPPQGAVAIIVSIPDQRVHVYRNGVRIAVSTCSTGKTGHATPTGVFTILEKDRHHHSSTYNNAPMPNMNRLTWQGVALHAGNLPGYPASHGCVRLPLEFSRRLFELTHVGTPVIIAGKHLDPAVIAHPGLVLSDAARETFDREVAKLNAKPHPKDMTTDAGRPARRERHCHACGDRQVTVIENGIVILAGEVAIVEPERPIGSHVYVLRGPAGDAAHLYWDAFVHSADPRERTRRAWCARPRPHAARRQRRDP